MAADRITRVSLVANVSNYVTGMNQAAQATRATGTAAEQLAQRREGIETLGKALLAVGTVAAAGVALAVTKFAEFDAAVSGIQAATHATTADMNSLRDAAVKAGADTVYSATEAANAITELAKAGVSTKDILGGGLDGALSLASAGELEVADAAQIAATAMTQFGLKGSEVPHVADLLAAGAGKAQGSVQDLSAALNQGGLVASQAGQSIDETTGVLAAFASQGLLGSDAGTSLKTALLALENPSTRAADVMKQYGIDVYDAQGNMDSFQEIAGTLQSKLGGLTDEQRNAALATIFGNDAVRAANVLYSNGSDGIAKWTKNVDDNGYAAETARLKLDNLRGDLERLGGSFDTALIQTGSSANGVLRTLVTAAGGLVDAFGSAPKPLLASGLALGTLVAVIGLVGGAALLAVPKFVAFKTAMSQVGVAGRTAAIGIGVLSVGLTAATLAIGYFVAEQAKISANTEQLVGTLDTATGALTKYSRAFVAKQLADSGAYDAARKAGVGQQDLTDAVIKGGKALDDVKSKLDSKNTIGTFFTGEGIKASKAKDEIVGLNKSVGDSKQAFKDQKKAGVDLADANGQVADTAADASDSVDGLGDSASDSADSLKDLKDTIDGLGSTTLDLRSAQRDMQAAIDDVTSAVKDNGKTLDIGTEKGRANQAALDGIAEKAKAVASATLEQTGSQKKASAAVAAGRSELIKALGQFGITGAAARAYADKLGLIPSNVRTTITMEQAQAAAAADALIRKISGIQRHIDISVQLHGAENLATTGGLKVARATGGPIVGPGTATSDSILAQLSNGEHVFTAAEVTKLGGQAAVERLRAQIRAGLIPKFANGGAVNRAQAELDKDIAAQKSAQRQYQDAKGAEKTRLKARVRDLQDQVTADRKALAAAKNAPTGASSSDRISFRSSVRAGEFDNEEGVSSLFSMGQDAGKYTSKQRAAFNAQANRSEVRMLKLEKASDKAGAAVEKAADKLGDLKDKSASLASSVASNLSSQGVSDFGSASSFARGQSRTAATLKQLRPLLDKLKKKGLSPALIAQIAGLEPVEALRMAKSFDALSGSAIRSVNADYKSVQSTAASIGKQVADANFGPQIKLAQTALTDARKNAKTIATEIKTQGLLLRKIVGKGLGLKGYSAGGYTGAGGVNEVAGYVHGKEFVSNARTTARFRPLLESLQGYASGGYVRPTYMRSAPQQSFAQQGQAGNTYSPTFNVQPVRDVDPQTALTIIGREINREMAGMLV